MLRQVAISHVVVYPDDWDRLDDVSRDEYRAAAVELQIELKIAYPATTNPNHLVIVRDGDFTALDAPYYFGPTECGRGSWEHNLGQILHLDDPCFGE